MAKHFVPQVSKGEKIGPHATADTWNAFADAANGYSRRVGPAKQPLHQKQQLTAFVGPFVRLDNDATRGQVVAFDGTTFDYADNNDKYMTQPILEGDYADDEPGRWGVSMGGRLGKATRLAMAGVVSVDLHVPPNGDWIDRCEIDPTNTKRLVSHPGGSSQILEKSGSSGDVKAVIRFGTPQNVSYRAKTTVQISSGSSGNVDLYNLGATGFTVVAHLGWMNHDNKPIEANSEVLVMWFPTEERWHIIGAQCTTSESETE